MYAIFPDGMKAETFSPIPSPLPREGGDFALIMQGVCDPLQPLLVCSIKVLSLGEDTAQARITFSAVGGAILGAPS